MLQGKRGHRATGVFGIIVGLLCLASLFAIDSNKLAIPNSDFFLVKYFLLILMVNGGLFFILFGILYLKGLAVPYYSHAITRYEKAKNNLFAVIFSIPLWVSFLTTIYIVAERVFWKIFAGFLLISIGWLFYSSFVVIRRTHKG